jgi:hypothetical protein
MKSPAIDGFWHCVRLRDGSAATQLDLPATAAGVFVLFEAMPTGANACIFAVQYQRLVSPVSGRVALGMSKFSYRGQRPNWRPVSGFCLCTRR